MNTLVINYHYTEKCNFRCVYCYAKREDSKELTTQGRLFVLEQLANVFMYNKENNRIYQEMGYDRVRLNFVGGEPLIDKDFGKLIVFAYKLGFDVSIVTNGFLFNDNFVKNYGKYISTVGISIDSADNDVMKAIGRRSVKGTVLDIDKLACSIELYRNLNNDGVVKINTVVNSHNKNEDVSDLVRKLSPERWKVLQVFPENEGAIAVAVTDDEFQRFVDRHYGEFQDVMCPENLDSIAGSYLMIDPKGRFFQNRVGQFGYDYSSSILDVGVDKALSEISFDVDKFCQRYTVSAK